jgi:hypothetical protein
VNTRSGEILSALLAVALALSILSAPNSSTYAALQASALMPEWVIAAVVSGLFCLCAAVSEHIKANALARFMSGCVWGTAVLALASQSLWLPVFWTALVLFLFDIATVITKGLLWTPKNRF